MANDASPEKEQPFNAEATDDVPAGEDVGWRRIVRHFTPS